MSPSRNQPTATSARPRGAPLHVERGSARWQWMAIVISAAAVGLATLGCGSDDAGDDGSKVASATLHPGACAVDLVWADGKRADNFIVWTYDANGHALRKDRLDDAVNTGFPTSTTTWTWNAAGQMTSEVLTPSDKKAHNHDWTWTYDAQGRAATRIGSTSSYKTESCVYEYSKVAAHPDDFVVVCDFSYDTFNKEGERTGTVTGKHAEQHTFYPDLPGTAYGVEGTVRREVIVRDDGEGGKPGGETAYVYDESGRLLATEQDSKLQGYPDNIIKRSYDTKGRRASRANDDDGDGAAELSATWSYDTAGNINEIAFDDGANDSVDYRWLHRYDCW
jgi:hypothetical protein